MILDDEIVVLVKHRGEYTWYVSERDPWVLDWGAWARAFRDAGYDDHDPNHTQRFGLTVVDAENVGTFLQHMNDHRVSISDLADAGEDGDTRVRPSLYVDFDSETIWVVDIDSPAFERYLPPGWTAKLEVFDHAIPKELCFWTKLSPDPS